MRFIISKKIFKSEKDRPRTFIKNSLEIVKACPAEVPVLFADKGRSNVRVGQVYETSQGSVQLLACQDVVELIVLNNF